MNSVADKSWRNANWSSTDELSGQPYHEVGSVILESVSATMVCVARFVLALGALIIVLIDPLKPNEFVGITYGALGCYALYSAFLYLAAARGWIDTLAPVVTWVDVASYLILIALSSGPGSIFFFFFFFSIIVASFRGGYLAGLKVTLVASILSTLLTIVSFASPDHQVELNRFLLRSLCLIVLGYMISVWGGLELTLKRRLALLKGISRSTNPRFGAEQTLCSFMERIRQFYEGESCLLVSQSPDWGDYFLRRADTYNANRAMRVEPVTGEIGCQLISLFGEEAVAVTGSSNAGGSKWCVSFAGDSNAKAGDPRWVPIVSALKHLIGDESFVSVPWPQRNGGSARLYITRRTGQFKSGDLEFLRHAVEHATAVIENVQLIDQLASAAAEHERWRISRDLHDSTIQPYVGLKIGIESIQRKADPDNPLVSDLNQLLMRTEIGLCDLRSYVQSLKREEPLGAEPVLSSAVQQYVDRFTHLYGIHVTCVAPPGIAVNDRLAAEALQIVREGLSNVHRHTSSRRAAVRLLSENGALVIEIENERDRSHVAISPFVPQSIIERARALGGTTHVVQRGGTVTVVRTEIPL